MSQIAERTPVDMSKQRFLRILKSLRILSVFLTLAAAMARCLVLIALFSFGLPLGFIVYLYREMSKGPAKKEPDAASNELTQGLLDSGAADQEGLESTDTKETSDDYEASDHVLETDKSLNSSVSSENYESVKRRYDFVVSDYVRCGISCAVRHAYCMSGTKTSC